MIRFVLISAFLIFTYTQNHSQDFKWGLKGGVGYSFYNISKTGFTDAKGTAYTFEGTSGVTSIILGASGILKIKNSPFYFSPELYYINGGGKIEFSNLSAKTPGGEKTLVTQKDQVFELAALIGVELLPIKLFLGPTFSYRVTTDGSASNYLEKIFPNTIGETNSQSLYINLQVGLGLMLSESSSINIRYSFPLVGNEFKVENNTYTNNAAFSMISIDYSYLFKLEK